MSRTVTERDFRKEEFVDAELEDYEFRADGKLVRKDRWEQGIREIAQLVGFTARDKYEIAEVIQRVKSTLEDC